MPVIRELDIAYLGLCKAFDIVSYSLLITNLVCYHLEKWNTKWVEIWTASLKGL